MYFFLAVLTWGGAEDCCGWGMWRHCLLHDSEYRMFCVNLVQGVTITLFHRNWDSERLSKQQSQNVNAEVYSKALYVCVFLNFSCLKNFSALYLVIFFVSKLFVFWGGRGHTWGVWKFPGYGLNWSYSCWAYTTATATQDRSHVCDLHHSSWQRQILNPLSEARDQTQVLMDTSWVRYRWAMTELLFVRFLPP